MTPNLISCSEYQSNNMRNINFKELCHLDWDHIWDFGQKVLISQHALVSEMG